MTIADFLLPSADWMRMDAEELKRRTMEFALRTIRLVEALPKTTAGRTIGNQLIRSGRAVGANYQATCKARSRAEFVAKIGIVEEDADESAYWMELLIASGIMEAKRVEFLLAEVRELSAIFGRSRITASSHLKKR